MQRVAAPSSWSAACLCGDLSDSDGPPLVVDETTQQFSVKNFSIVQARRHLGISPYSCFAVRRVTRSDASPLVVYVDLAGQCCRHRSSEEENVRSTP